MSWGRQCTRRAALRYEFADGRRAPPIATNHYKFLIPSLVQKKAYTRKFITNVSHLKKVGWVGKGVLFEYKVCVFAIVDMLAR